MAIFYVDGAFVPEEKAVLPVTDLALLRGYGVFDFMRTYGGRPFHLDKHVQRLINSAALIELACPWSKEELIEIVGQTLARNECEEANIRLLITGGDSSDSITPGERPRLLVMVKPLKKIPADWYEDGVKIVTAECSRYIPGAKSIDYIRAILTLKEAHRTGGVEAVYVDAHQGILEGTTSNIFMVRNGRVFTPDEGILPGVTRDVVLSVIAEEFSPEFQSFSRQELYEADEVFLTASNKEVLPVRQIDDHPVGTGRPGAITRRVMTLFHTYTTQYGC